MGLTASAKNALRISLPHGAATEVIGLLDRLADEFAAHDATASTRHPPSACEEAKPGPGPSQTPVPTAPAPTAAPTPVASDPPDDNRDDAPPEPEPASP